MSLNKQQNPIKVGIAGTGFVGRGLSLLLANRGDMQVSGVLTRQRGPIPGLGVPANMVINEPRRLFELSDVIVVSTGDPLYSTEIIDLAFEYGLPVVTMDVDTLVVAGSWLKRRGLVTEAEGDQPGCLAALKEETLQMGFTPLVFGNIKWYLNHFPTLEDMQYWGKKQGYSLQSVTSFTDGTKLQTEQCLVANGLGATITRQGLEGIRSGSLEEGSTKLAGIAKSFGKPISDYIICHGAPPGVFIAAAHDAELAWGLETYKMGKGPFYLLHRPYHLCYFEIPKTILRFMQTREVLLDNGLYPEVSVGAIAKKELVPGTLIEKGIGSMEMRGEALKILDEPEHVPVGLMDKVHIKRKVEAGQLITWDDIDFPESKAATAWIETLNLLKAQFVAI
jgi:predicted homoserine dehydrogenase-like protein